MRTNEPEVLGQVLDRFPPGWKPAATPVVAHLYSVLVGGVGSRPNVRRYNLLYAGAARLARTMKIEEIFDVLETELDLAVALNARRRVFVHAGVVGWRKRAIVIPGRAFSGKTTLVAELVRLGATYYSDEYAVFDERARIQPYPRRLGIRTNGDVQPTKSTVESLGGLRGVKPLPVGMIVVTHYEQGRRWRPRRISNGIGALALLNNTLSVRTRPQQVLTTIVQSAAHAPALSGTRGEACEMAESLLERFDRLVDDSG